MRLPRFAPIALLLLGCPKPAVPEAPAPAPIAYPDAARGDVVDDYHGTSVADPYRWLEDPQAPESRTWIDAQNALTHGIIGAVPQRQAIHDRLTKMWNYERYGTPSKKGGKYFYSKNDGLQDHSVLYMADTLDAEPTVVLDPNSFSEDGTVSLGSTAVCKTGQYMAYATSDGGSDWRTVQVLDLTTLQPTEDKLDWVKFSGMDWTPDCTGFYYSRYPTPENKLEQVNEHQKVYFHKVGTPQSDDPLVFEDTEHPQRGWGASVTDDGKNLVLYGWEGTEDKNRVWFQPFDPANPVGGEWTKLHDDFDASFHLLGTVGSEHWYQTNLDAPKGRVIKIDVDKPARDNWVEVLAEGEDVLESASMLGDTLFGIYIQDAKSVVQRSGLDGSNPTSVALPGIGSTWGFGGDQDATETFYGFTGYTTPTTLFSYDIASGESKVFREPTVDFDPSQYETKQVFYESKDGTKVPMFITHKKGLVLDGSNPTLLYGYGGFNISLTPGFRTANVVWMEMGGVYAVANLRGGGEYGQAWHKAGTLDQKQNVFDDFIGAGEWLIANNYTQPDKLAINGGSNGGLLVGAVITQRPELFGAAVPAVGVLDMLRYHEFTIGWAWASDYGRSDDPEMFPHLLAYSPYHNAKPGTAYPSTLILTGDHDDRVVPAHSFKFAAAMQHATAGPDPVLIRIETRAGHGAGKSTSMRIDEKADMYAFLVRELGMQVDLPAPMPAAPAVDPGPAPATPPIE